MLTVNLIAHFVVKQSCSQQTATDKQTAHEDNPALSELTAMACQSPGITNGPQSTINGSA